MNPHSATLRRIFRIPSHILSFWRRFCFRIWAVQRLANLRIGRGTVLNVPVRSGGRGSLVIGKRNIFGYRYAPLLGSGEILLQPRNRDATITIGDNNIFSNNVSIVSCGAITIGDGCQIGDQVSIFDCDFHQIESAKRNEGVGPILPVTIADNVWLGSRVMVLKGVNIGANTVVGAMSLVTKDLPANCVAAGCPAKVLRSIE